MAMAMAMTAAGRPLARALAALVLLPRALRAGWQPADDRGSATPLVGIFPTIPAIDYLAQYSQWVEQFGVATVLLPAEGDADELFDKRWPLPAPATNSTVRWGRMNGMLIPGGGGPVAPLARALMLRAVKANSEGMYWPVWGTCLGFEWIVQVFGGEGALQSGFDSTDMTSEINLTQVPERIRMLEFANSSVLGWLTQLNVTYEDHTSGIEPEHFMKSLGLAAQFDIVASSVDRKGRPNVAMIQGKGMPFYGVQFHPEKVRYARNGPYLHHIPKTPEARCVADDLAKFFASELQKSLSVGHASDVAMVV